ncbi:hypothetical protein IJI17_00995 [Candidatus Saccharibacteria bacterium]|nr:hypothetical protein [Candidatus Saccharibacteria bacterium]
MLKSTKIVLSLGLALGASVAILPTRSFAAITIVTSEAQVSATIAGVVGLSATSHATGSNTSYDSTNNIYTGSFLPHEYTDNFGTTTYEVLCNYRAANYSGNIYYDSDGDETYETIWKDSNNQPVAPANADCAAGWKVQATAPAGYVSGGAAVMTTGGSPAYTIPSTTPTSTTSFASSTSANWGMKVAGISKTVSSTAFTPAPATGFDVFHATPAAATDVISGSTFRTVDGVANTYIGTESFSVTYGFNSGMAVAGTYTGQVEYTLYIGNN